MGLAKKRLHIAPNDCKTILLVLLPLAACIAGFALAINNTLSSKNENQVRRHMMSPDTYERHVSNSLTTWATWNKIAVIAIRLEGSGWKKVQMPHYPQSGCTFQPIEVDQVVDSCEFDLAAEGNLAAMRAWAASLCQ